MQSGTALRRTIAKAEKLLPGKPLADLDAPDERWQAIIQVGYFIEEHPEPIWEFAVRWGKHPQTDLRDAVATVLLEHLLEHHFPRLLPRLREQVKISRRFKDTLSRCYWMGEAARPSNARLLDRLAGKKRPRLRIPPSEQPQMDAKSIE